MARAARLRRGPSQQLRNRTSGRAAHGRRGTAPLSRGRAPALGDQARTRRARDKGRPLDDAQFCPSPAVTCVRRPSVGECAGIAQDRPNLQQGCAYPGTGSCDTEERKVLFSVKHTGPGGRRRDRRTSGVAWSPRSRTALPSAGRARPFRSTGAALRPGERNPVRVQVERPAAGYGRPSPPPAALSCGGRRTGPPREHPVARPVAWALGLASHEAFLGAPPVVVAVGGGGGGGEAATTRSERSGALPSPVVVGGGDHRSTLRSFCCLSKLTVSF